MYPVRWVKVSRFCELTGDTPGAVKARIHAGKWIEGVHWRTRDKRRYINLPEYDKWVERNRAAA